MTSPPLPFVAEIRAIFRQSALQRKTHVCRKFSNSVSSQLKATPAGRLPRGRNNPATTKHHASPEVATPKRSALQGQKKHSEHAVIPESRQELVPHQHDRKAVGHRRTTDAPMKVIPKADLTPNLRLSPRERLHIEVLTRRPPPQTQQVKPYKERLLIYHHGNITNNALVFLKVSGLLCASAMTMIYVPAHYLAGTSPWTCASLLVAGFTPIAVFHYLLKPMVTRVYLRLPPNARASPGAAMSYARNLPSSAQIDIDFARITALPGTVTVNIADIQPLSPASRWPWQIANLERVSKRTDQGSFFRRNPAEFYVRSEIGPGRAKRDVIPGIWPEVYNRLTGVVREQLDRWKKQ